MAGRTDSTLRWLFGASLLARLCYPLFDSPLTHLFSDPDRHWQNGAHFLKPSMMGAGDPFLYQLWIYLLRTLTHDSAAWILLGCGLLCAAMPYGWYRALRELLPRRMALGGALLIALMPSFIGIYSFFMTETLLLTLTGFAFWCTFRLARKRTLGAWTLCCVVWSCAAFTRTIALPIALLCLGSAWLAQPQRWLRAGVGALALAALAVPAALHSRPGLGYYAPFGNTYITEIYRASGRHDIALDCGWGGSWGFGSPSFSNETFYPFSHWTTGRTGVAAVKINLSLGRASWLAERERVARDNPLSGRTLFAENAAYLLFGQSWPDNNLDTLPGAASVWNRWLWLPLMLYILWGAWRRAFRGWEWLLPVCGLGMMVFLAVQTTAIMEGRYRKPIEPILLAAAIVVYARRHAGTRNPQTL
ncbi:MAG TPA: glycosyltransferase family 39 protein [Steroidobacteraceae bacterium]|nr:glycosyltransferase family 39 protein [Steroidobacteraceae bacterium]